MTKKLQVVFAVLLLAALCLDSHGVDGARRRGGRRRRHRRNKGGGLTAFDGISKWRCEGRKLLNYIQARSSLKLLGQACIQTRQNTLSCVLAVDELPTPLVLPFTIRCGRKGWTKLEFGGLAKGFGERFRRHSRFASDSWTYSRRRGHL